MKLVNDTVVANQGSNVHYANETNHLRTSLLWNNIIHNATDSVLTVTGGVSLRYPSRLPGIGKP